MHRRPPRLPRQCSRYEETPDTHHDHLIDLKTGQVVEFVDEQIEAPQAQIAKRLGSYRLVDHRLESLRRAGGGRRGVERASHVLPPKAVSITPRWPAKSALYIKTYGCQMNVYDSERMADLLRPLGYVATDAPEHADLIVLNTCHIREKATEKVYSELGQLKRLKAERARAGAAMTIAVAGCVAQAEGAEIGGAASRRSTWWSRNRKPTTGCQS